jgi:signal transduction histidine kinase
VSGYQTQRRTAGISECRTALGENLLVIINDILDFSKIEANKIEIENLSIDLPQMLKDLIPVHQNAASRKI